MKRYLFVFGILAVSSVSMGLLGQTDPSKNYENCAYWELIEQLRAYEDTLAFEQSAPDTIRKEYGLPVTDAGISAKMYRLYRCAALLDSLANLQDSLAFVRADPPTVDSDSISGITGSAATLHGRILSDGGESVTARWFLYGTTRTALADSIGGTVGLPDSLFTASISALTPAGTWYMAAFAKNAKGTSSGDTLQFVVPVAPTMDTDSIASITATTATFHGRTLSTGGAALSHRWFRYGTSAAALNDSIAGVAGTPDSLFTASVTSLTAGTYYVAAFGKNLVGTSSGDTLQFVVPVAPTMDTDSMSARTATTATLHGKVVSNGGGALTHQWFRYGLTAASLTDSIAVSGTTTPFSVGVSGLTPATQYYYAAFGKNAAGTATGDTLSFWTKCSVDSVVYNSYTYGVVQIGDQCWFDENLQTTKFSDGTAIPSPATNALWAGLSTPGHAEHNDKVRTEDGLLYNWYAASDSKGLCPSGWHVPTEAAFDSLSNFLGVSTAGNQLRVGSPIWDGTNETGFSGLPSGGRAGSTGNFYGYNIRAIFWSTTVDTANPSNAARAALTSVTPTLGMTTLDKRTGMSVRCLQD